MTTKSISRPSSRSGTSTKNSITFSGATLNNTGTITNVVVDKKSYKGNSTRVTVKDIHIKVDNCVGASSLRSYAVLTSSGTDTDDIVGYYGVTKTF